MRASADGPNGGACDGSVSRRRKRGISRSRNRWSQLRVEGRELILGFLSRRAQMARSSRSIIVQGLLHPFPSDFGLVLQRSASDLVGYGQLHLLRPPDDAATSPGRAAPRVRPRSSSGRGRRRPAASRCRPTACREGSTWAACRASRGPGLRRRRSSRWSSRQHDPAGSGAAARRGTGGTARASGLGCRPA